MEDPTATHAANVCTVCREQKRKCDKKLPFCSRCVQLKRPCNYTWQVPEQTVAPAKQENNRPDLLFQFLQSGSDNAVCRSPNVDRLFVSVALKKLAEQSVSVDQILGDYFSNIHPWLPVILEQPFRQRLSKLQAAPRAETALVLLTVLLMMHRGARDVKGTSRKHIYNLCKYLFSFLQLRRGPSVELVQSGLLLVLYELGDSSPSSASLSIATCARLGYALKLNVDKGRDHEDMISWMEGEERRRVWAGLYMLDRLIYQVATEFKAPHVVEELAPNFRLPVDDSQLDGLSDEFLQSMFQATMSTPVDVPLGYFPREVQAIHILGHVQALQRAMDAEWSPQKSAMLDQELMQYAERLFEQTPGSWMVLCGANSITLIAALTLHQLRLARANKARNSEASYAANSSLLAIPSFVNMVRDICLKFNAQEATAKIDWVPLPAVVVTGEAALAALQMKQLLGEECQLDPEPLRQTLIYASRYWKLSEHYLRRID
ncbi:hypothetical protein FE257_002462 [Aspergillus nanangensis]|uniref:Zn(2)-C6 fungal-type domain-containing protein n=1 Tax=Aspergillus nanangensis TaxID=2582783 RepID=A0AAD4CT28_ASPNN|nr:hypothetical protein FE257_002462 [Aspergillus nanangensis]